MILNEKKNKKLFKSESGFTLIELLVVLGIISVLVTIGTIHFGNANATARNVKRQADIQLISKALQVFYVKNSRFYQASDITTTGTDKDKWFEFMHDLGISGTIPPRDAEEYCYFTNAISNPTGYALVITNFVLSLLM